MLRSILMPESFFRTTARKGPFPKVQSSADPDKAAKEAYLLGGLAGTA